MNKIIFSLSLIILPISVSIAIDVGDITETINSDKNILSKEIKNTVSTARLVNLNVQKISSPMGDGVPLTMSSKDELLSTPANLILPGGASDIFKVIYNGPADDKERYYRLNWQDDPVSDNGSTTSHKSAVATTSATISTILVVAPRIENFNYQYNNGVVQNTGNSSFRVVASGPCLASQIKYAKNGICRERYYLMPNLKVKMQRVDTANKKTTIGIWHKEEFIIAK
ncbi:hypothetical protein [Moellerella wisconsensis]|uniref:EcpB family pilus assembly chaperone n=1 Tax=Moellerella wisconsensis TaxID=158849 RepID=UPI001F4EA52F|nr:hypothetical protein [Moellerella wisconsensis]UNH25673.1 hypothetical protein MNY68_07210 [Moellerella wisconsensis]